MHTTYKQHSCESNLATSYGLNPEHHLVMKVRHCPDCDIAIGDELAIPQIRTTDYDDREPENCVVCNDDPRYQDAIVVDVVPCETQQDYVPSEDRLYNYYKVVTVIDHPYE